MRDLDTFLDAAKRYVCQKKWQGPDAEDLVQSMGLTYLERGGHVNMRIAYLKALDAAVTLHRLHYERRRTLPEEIWPAIREWQSKPPRFRDVLALALVEKVLANRRDGGRASRLVVAHYWDDIPSRELAKDEQCTEVRISQVFAEVFDRVRVLAQVRVRMPTRAH